MQNSYKEITPAKKARLTVQTKTGRWQQPEVVELKFTGALAGNFSRLHKLVALEPGVPFSPLND